MNANAFWQVILDTGAPEMYLLYSKAHKSEENYAFEDPGACAPGDRL